MARPSLVRGQKVEIMTSHTESIKFVNTESAGGNACVN